MSSSKKWLAEATGEVDDGRVWYRWVPGGGDGVGELTFGVTFFTTDTLGEIERVTLPEEGDKLSKGDILFSLEGTLETYDWPAIFPATVIEVNHELLEEPELLNEDPQDAGWLVRLELQDENDLEKLLKEEGRSRGRAAAEDDEDEAEAEDDADDDEVDLDELEAELDDEDEGEFEEEELDS